MKQRLADYVADFRAPTPTGAAEIAVPNIVDLKHNITQYKIRLKNHTQKGGCLCLNKSLRKALKTL